MSSWTQFFRDAGIPSSASKSYATTFEDNRITKDMLLDLNKEILNDMGIKVMGDVISILKHAKKVHSQESRRSELAGSSTGGVAKPSSSKMPAAHSTTPGAAVSTTSVNSVRRTRKHSDMVSGDIPADSWTTEVYAGEPLHPRSSYQDMDTERVDTTVEPLNTLRSDHMLSPSLDYVDTLDAPGNRMLYDDQPLEEYTTAAYEKRQKRPFTMYSDEIEYSPPKHPRVITVPNESQDIYTTTALQNAAAIVAAVESQKLLEASVAAAAAAAAGGGVSEGEGSPISERNRRLLEAAGLIPTQQRERTTSVFSRLDHEPTSPTLHHQPIPRASHINADNSITVEASAPRKIRISRPAPVSRSVIEEPGNVSGRTLVSKIATSSVEDNKPKISNRFSGRLGEKKEPATVRRSQSATEGILASEYKTSAISGSYSSPGIRKKDSSSKVSERLGIRVRGNTTERIKLPEKVKSPPSSSKGLHVRSKSATVTEPGKPSMVADEYEYQTLRQMDIRSRLEKKEMEKKARRRGLLPGRLGQHHVFGRLE